MYLLGGIGGAAIKMQWFYAECLYILVGVRMLERLLFHMVRSIKVHEMKAS
jgi:hypothetical protein